MFKRIDHVEIIPFDLEKSIKFYTEVLGFKLKERFKVEVPPLEEVAFLQGILVFFVKSTKEGEKNERIGVVKKAAVC